MNNTVTLSVNGRSVTIPTGTMVSAAVSLAGVTVFRRSITGEPRAPLCGMGICFECRVTINARPHMRACQIPCSSGMEVRTEGRAILPAASFQPASRQDCPPYNVVIVGAGPAGLAAARRATECGGRVAIIDDNPARGGQIWRALPVPREWESAPTLITGARVVAAPEARTLLLESFDAEEEIRYGSLILATGARERFLPFPGWTLPHVMGAGGLQALAKSGMPIAGKRIVVAGSGPLLLAVAKYLKDHGAKVALIAEQADQVALAGFGFALALSPTKLLQGAMLMGGLAGVPYMTSCWPVAAAPGSVTLRRGTGKTWTEPCDYLACGFGLIPNTELAALLGCQIANGRVLVDKLQQTSVPGVYAAGEVTGVGGLDLSLVEGEIAGYAAGGKPHAAAGRFGARASGRRFAEALERGFALRKELKTLAKDDTIVCRCEDVPLGRLRAYAGWREAKLQTRCGMGPCQGRVCGGAVEFLLGWTGESVRPPIFPARIGTIDQTSSS